MAVIAMQRRQNIHALAAGREQFINKGTVQRVVWLPQFNKNSPESQKIP
jgi:hypothetical protein